ncbi:MFS transporter [Pseudomonas turukhanskensis]|uniref:MFS transporter n=1 Tax=Pseudomonas turukhanskensis TaxID=1806536 RepID=A0A9W6K972_9PSED|nr:MFS transporter [Pseudomonas turukhanskensis]GLK91237.1 MFS transporter [Pseudomonas turukhanskensis]
MGLFADQPGDDGAPGKERRLATIAVMTTTAMAVIDGTIANVALPSISNALNVSAADTIWVANGYLLAAAMTLITFSALATRVGFRALYASGGAVFTLASLGCALSTNLEMLTAMRVLQGIGGAAALSIGPAIYRTVFPTRLLGRILGLNALLVAASTAIGPTLGGIVLSVAGWEWLFALNIPLGIVGVTLALRAIPRTATVKGPFDLLGACLSAIAMGAAILATDAFTNNGQGAGPDLMMAALYSALTLLSALAFVWRQQRAPAPLLPLDIFTSSRFSLAAMTSLVAFVSQGIIIISLPFLFQNAYGYNVFHAALLFTAWPIGIVLAAPQAGRLADHYRPAMLSTIGLALFTLGLLLLAFVPSPQALDILWKEFLCGVGFGFFQSPNNREMLANVTRERSGSASGVLAIVRTFGQCFGAALVAIILATYTSDSASPATGVAENIHAMHLTIAVAAAAAALAACVSFARLRS